MALLIHYKHIAYIKKKANPLLRLSNYSKQNSLKIWEVFKTIFQVLNVLLYTAMFSIVLSISLFPT